MSRERKSHVVFARYSCSSGGAEYFLPCCAVSCCQMYSNWHAWIFNVNGTGAQEIFLLWNFCSYDRKFLPSRCIFIRITLFGMIFIFLGKGRFISCIFPQLFPVKCILTLTPGFSMRFPVTHFKFPGDNVPASPAKETA